LRAGFAKYQPVAADRSPGVSMPTYDYKCNACGHVFDELQSFSEPPLTKCPKCKKNKLERLFGGGGAIIFKGGGFYETDYRRAGEAAPKGDGEAPKGETKETKAETPAASTDSAPAKTETKTESKSETKGGGAKKKGK
jgi:putative FmdB family regulatory protein